MNNPDVLNGQVRAVLAALLGYYAGKHLDPDLVKALPPGSTELVISLVAAAPSMIWSAWAKRRNALARLAEKVLRDNPDLAKRLAAKAAEEEISRAAE